MSGGYVDACLERSQTTRRPKKADRLFAQAERLDALQCRDVLAFMIGYGSDGRVSVLTALEAALKRADRIQSARNQPPTN